MFIERHAFFAKKVDDITTQQRILENSTYNGKLLWKIDNISVQITQAEKVKLSLYIVLPHTLIAMDINFALKYTWMVMELGEMVVSHYILYTYEAQGLAILQRSNLLFD